MNLLLGRRRPGLVELLYRGKQEADKWFERTLSLSPVLAAHRRPADVGAFFAGAGEPGTPGLCAREVPCHVDSLIERARRLCDSRFSLLGHSALSYGAPIDWHLDPIRGRRAPQIHWSRIDPLDCAALGDSKVIWEVSRHQWLVTLAQAYKVGGQRRHVEQILATLAHWDNANPYGVGLNWASSLEVALRLMAWCWVLQLLDSPGVIGPASRRFLVEGIATHASYVARYLSYYFSPNTHLTGEAVGLFYAGTVLGGAQAREWRDLGARILVEQASRQILPDGVYIEQATCYQRYTAEIYLHFLILAEQSHFAVPTEVGASVERLLDALLVLCRPDRVMPQIGDADGGWLVPLADREPSDCRGIFSTAAAFFNRPDYAWAAGGLAPETLWLLGESGVDRFKALTPAPPRPDASRVLPDGGYVVMRDSWRSDAHQLLFDVGPLGCPASGGHGHADLLSLQVSPFGQACLIDPGTGEYPDERGWRSAFRSTAAHSTVRVDQCDQAVPVGLFSWSAPRPAARLHAFGLDDPALQFADASHSGFPGPGAAVTHRRRVGQTPVCWVVVDELSGPGSHAVELRWQFAPLALTDVGGAAVLAHLSDGRGMWLVPVSPVPLRQRIAVGADNPQEGWYSPAYGQRVPAPLLVYEATAALPVRIVTLLVPQVEATATPPDVRPRVGRTGKVIGVHLPGLGLDLGIDDLSIRSCVA